MVLRTVLIGVGTLAFVAAQAATPVEGRAYITVQGANAVEVVPQGTTFDHVTAAHYDDVSRDGRVLAVTSAKPGQVYILDAATGKQRAVIATGESTQGVKITPDGRQALVVDPDAGNVAVIDLKALKLVKKIPVGKTPHNVVYSDDGATAYVSLQGQAAVAVVDMHALTKTGEIATLGIDTPHNLDLTADGRELWIRDFVGNVGVIDLASKKLTHTIAVGKGHGGIDVIPGGRYVFAGAIADDRVDVIDPKTYKVIKRIQVGLSPHGVRASRDGRWVYVDVFGEDAIAVIDTNSLTVVKRIKTGKGPFWGAVQGND